MSESSRDFRQSDVAGSQWRRSNHGEFNNPYGGQSWVRFDWEDRVVLANGQSIGTPAPSTVRYFNNPDTALAILNPETGEPTGQVITHGSLYAILWSLARESALLKEEEDRQAAEAAASFDPDETVDQ